MADLPHDSSQEDVEAQSDESKIESDRVGRSTRITFEEISSADGQRSIYQPQPKLPPRSKSQDTIRSSRSSTQTPATTGIPIEFRTLSIQISESQNATEEVFKARQQKEKQPNQDYFEGLDFHILGVDKLCQQFNVDSKCGLSDSAAATRPQRDGRNVIAHHRENYLKKLLKYVFGGFCSVLWVGVIIFFLCWKPLSNPPSITNLAMAILVIIVILLQAGFSAFQDWSTKQVMNSILDLLPSEALILRENKKNQSSIFRACRWRRCVCLHRQQSPC